MYNKCFTLELKSMKLVTGTPTNTTKNKKMRKASYPLTALTGSAIHLPIGIFFFFLIFSCCFKVLFKSHFFSSHFCWSHYFHDYFYSKNVIWVQN